ncbi:hypothetical protein BGX21_006162, partial [Mortierella sp. AD011]
MHNLFRYLPTSEAPYAVEISNRCMATHYSNAEKGKGRATDEYEYINADATGEDAEEGCGDGDEDGGENWDDEYGLGEEHREETLAHISRSTGVDMPSRDAPQWTETR